jgi:gamma-glutamyltranspeptidase/glutathione hydrolase
MAATASYPATEAAAGILARGGNAVDAAVAAAFALGVCEPAASGLGGQTVMMIYLAQTGKTIALDGSSRAPNRIAVVNLSRSDRLRGHRATTVPSTPAVLGYALEHYGTKSLAQVIEPAVVLADEGYQITELQYALTRREATHLRAGSAGRFFLKDGRRPYPVGATFRQPVLAGTLRRLAEAGVEDFYLGQISRHILEDMFANDGLIFEDDLAWIPWPVERKPLAGRFDGLRLFTFGPPGAGRTLVEMLNIIEHLPEKYRNFDTPQGAVVLAETIRRANLDRRDRPFDPNFYPQVQDRRMVSAEYAEMVARQVRTRIKTRGETTHLSVMDAAGNTVALTQSIERVYGSCEASPELGFLYNNYMSAFEYQDMTHPYYLRPNAVPWASVAPTIIFKGRRPWLALGSPGSERITSAMVQVLLRLGSHAPLEAVSAPRLHCSIQGKVSLEAARFRDDILPALQKRGFSLDIRDPHSFYLGCVQLVMRDKDTLIGVADPRRDGSAAGPRK